MTTSRIEEYAGPNSSVISVGSVLMLYFSYQTLVAFFDPRVGLFVRQNVWGTTTGRHLNVIDEGRTEERLSEKEFEQCFAAEIALLSGFMR